MNKVLNFGKFHDLYEKGDSENEHQNKHFAMYVAIIALRYYF
jgi:hypothetical protein